MARNRYQDRCYVCGLPVLVGTGHFQREGNGWLTKHALHTGDGRVTCEMAKDAAAKKPEPADIDDHDWASVSALGPGLLAFAYRLHSKDASRQVVSSMFERIARSANAVDSNAAEILETGVSKPVGN